MHNFEKCDYIVFSEFVFLMQSPYKTTWIMKVRSYAYFYLQQLCIVVCTYSYIVLNVNYSILVFWDS